MKKRYTAPVVEVSTQKFSLNGITAEIEPGTATVAAAGIITGAGIVGAVASKGCW